MLEALQEAAMRTQPANPAFVLATANAQLRGWGGFMQETPSRQLVF
jgi:hypothetical protein